METKTKTKRQNDKKKGAIKQSTCQKKIEQGHSIERGFGIPPVAIIAIIAIQYPPPGGNYYTIILIYLVFIPKGIASTTTPSSQGFRLLYRHSRRRLGSLWVIRYVSELCPPNSRAPRTVHTHHVVGRWGFTKNIKTLSITGAEISEQNVHQAFLRGTATVSAERITKKVAFSFGKLVEYFSETTAAPDQDYRYFWWRRIYFSKSIVVTHTHTRIPLL